MSKYKSTGLNFIKDSSKVIDVEKNSIAKKQGIEINDTILKVNGEDVLNNPERILEIVNESNGELNYLIKRHGKEQEIKLIPEEKSQYYLGVTLKKAEDTFKDRIYYAFYDTYEFCTSIVENLKDLVTGNVSKNQVKGPVGISSEVSKTKGLKDYVYIIALISLSLGVTNLLPFPPLDGGKILILLIEAIRRKPLKQETEIKIQMLGFMLMIGLAIYVTYNDIWNLF